MLALTKFGEIKMNKILLSLILVLGINVTIVDTAFADYSFNRDAYANKVKEQEQIDANKIKAQEQIKINNEIKALDAKMEVKVREAGDDPVKMKQALDWYDKQLAQIPGTEAYKKEQERKANAERDVSIARAKAAQEAFEYIDGRFGVKNEKIIPIRPVVLGGDDFTMICRADFAVEYTTAFLQAFENNTKAMGHSLTSCAGIAFIKSSFPFHYGVKLAESLCEAAKKDAKSEEMSKYGLPPSCLMFHKVQDSFVTDYNAIVDRELKAVGNYTWKFGPYYLNENIEGRWCISDLINKVRELDGEEGNAVKSSIRQWLSAMHSDKGYADQLLKRAKQIAKGKAKDTLEDAVDSNRAVKIKNVPYTACPAYDILSLHSVMYQVTK